MFAYTIMNERKAIDTGLPGIWATAVITGILLASMTLAGARNVCKIQMPFEENAAENSYAAVNMTGGICEKNTAGGYGSGVLSSVRFMEYSAMRKDMPSALDADYIAERVEPIADGKPDLHAADVNGTAEAPAEFAEVIPEETSVIAEGSDVPDAPKEEEPAYVNLQGFLCDAAGMIIGCDGVSVVDGVLCLPSDKECAGISADALASLGGRVCEIYIPANIVKIDSGAFNGLTNLVYIEVHPDNPVYESSGGVLHEK